MGAAMMLAICPQISSAEEFTSATFLTWSRTNQDWYLETTIATAIVIATQNSGKQVACLNDWYYKDAATKAARNDHIRGVMAQYPDHYPVGILIAVLQKACGSFKYDSGS